MKTNTDKLEELVETMYLQEDKNLQNLSDVLAVQIKHLKLLLEGMEQLNDDMEQLVAELDDDICDLCRKPFTARCNNGDCVWSTP